MGLISIVLPGGQLRRADDARVGPVAEEIDLREDEERARHAALLELAEKGDASLRGKLTERDSLAVELGGLYWHFVDIVWIVIFTLVYLIQTQ